MNYPAAYYPTDGMGGHSGNPLMPFWIDGTPPADGSVWWDVYQTWKGDWVFQGQSGLPDDWQYAGTWYVDSNGTNYFSLAACEANDPTGCVAIQDPVNAGIFSYSTPVLADATMATSAVITLPNGSQAIAPGLYYLPDGRQYMDQFFAWGGALGIPGTATASFVHYAWADDGTPLREALKNAMPAVGPGGGYGFIFNQPVTHLDTTIAPPSIPINLVQEFGPIIGAIAVGLWAASEAANTTSTVQNAASVSTSIPPAAEVVPADYTLPTDLSTPQDVQLAQDAQQSAQAEQLAQQAAGEVVPADYTSVAESSLTNAIPTPGTALPAAAPVAAGTGVAAELATGSGVLSVVQQVERLFSGTPSHAPASTSTPTGAPASGLVASIEQNPIPWLTILGIVLTILKG